MVILNSNLSFIIRLSYSKKSLNKCLSPIIRKPNGLSIQEIEKYYIHILTKRDWVYISRHYTLPSDFISCFCDELDWKNICKYQKINNFNFYLKNIVFIAPHRDLFFKYQDDIPDQILDRMEKHWWLTYSTHGKFDDEKIIKYKDKLNWSNLCMRKDLHIKKSTLLSCIDSIPLEVRSRINCL